MSVTILLWKYNPKVGTPIYTAAHVNAMCRMLAQYVTIPYRVVCITDDPDGVECETYPLWPYKEPVNNKGRMDCYRRLHVFHPDVMQDIGGDVFCSIDLDATILGNIDHLLSVDEEFMIMAGSINRYGKQICPYNGGFWICKAGARPQFAEFNYQTDPTRLQNHTMANGKLIVGSDQAYMAIVSPNEKVFPKEYGLRQFFQRPSVEECSILFFAGKGNLPWSIKTYDIYPDVWKKYFFYSTKEIR